jgi:hypothetical protein
LIDISPQAVCRPGHGIAAIAPMPPLAAQRHAFHAVQADRPACFATFPPLFHARLIAFTDALLLGHYCHHAISLAASRFESAVSLLGHASDTAAVAIRLLR